MVWQFDGAVPNKQLIVNSNHFFADKISKRKYVIYSVCRAGLFGTFLGAKPEAKVLADVPNDDSSELHCLDQLIFWFWDII